MNNKLKMYDEKCLNIILSLYMGFRIYIHVLCYTCPMLYKSYVIQVNINSKSLKLQ